VRKACQAIGLSRSAWYRPLVDWLERDRPIAEALSALVDDKPGLGFWKLYRRLRRRGRKWNHKRSDALCNGVRFRTFIVLDDFSRDALAIEVDTSLPSRRLVRVFEQLKAERGLPDVLCTDNGPEFLGEAFVSLCEENGILIDYIEPGKPNQNVFIERFNRSYREEVLDTRLFRNLDEVRELSWAWMLEYNEDRDDDGFGGMTPVEALQHARVSNFALST